MAGILPANDQVDQNKDQDEHFIVLDLNTKVSGFDVGLHWYGAYGKVCIPTASTECIDTGPTTNDQPATKLNQTWIGPHFTAELDTVKLHGALLYNTGKIGSTKNDGFLVRVEPSLKLGSAGISLLGVYSSGKDNGKGFLTVHNILGTGGTGLTPTSSHPTDPPT